MSDAAPEKAPRKKRGLRWFFIDLWWVHVIVIIVVTLCVSLPLVYVGYPRIAQGDVNDSKLNITRMSITKPRPDGFALDLTTKLDLNSIFHPWLRAWNGSLNLAGSDESYLTLEIPGFQAKDGALTTITREITLDEGQLDTFTDYVKVLLVNDTVTSYLNGRGNLRLGALPTVSVKYNKTLEMAGFSGLKGIKIHDTKLLSGTQPDNATLAGKVTIPNHSTGTVELGNLTFGVSLPAGLLNSTPTALGYATVNNTFLEAGKDNEFDLRSVADQSLVLEAISKNQTLLTSGLPITIVTRKVEYDGEEIPWLTTSLASTQIEQILNVTELLGGGGGE